MQNHLERFRRMHRLIKFRRTGSPEEFASRLGVSSSLLYRLLNDLKSMGGPIVYCPTNRSYVYGENVDLHLGYVRTERPSSTTSVRRQLVPDTYVRQIIS